MSRENRAALTGFEGAIKEMARVTGEKVELDEAQKVILDEKLERLMHGKTPAMFTYFRKDERKEGGEYVTASGSVKKIDLYTHYVILEDGMRIPVGDILEIEEIS